MAESLAASGETDAVAGGPPRRERLAQRRKALGLTQEDLAALLKVERSTVVRWERGETEPLPWLRPRLARALRVSADRLAELLDDTGRPGGALPGEGDSHQATRRGPMVTPRQLPATVTDFTGRVAELAALAGILDNAGDSAPGTVMIAAIGGTAGVGKTALALHWAHQVADQFTDGQLHVNLRGFDPSGTPVTSGEAIRGFLDALGVPRSRIPPSPDAQAALYRSLLAGKRVLIVLDNARDEQQVRPLLPASPASLVVVTSRSQLTGLAAAHGARLVPVDVLSHAEAVQFVTARVGAGRAAAEPAAIAEIAALCACLPLALSVAAARTAGRPRLPLAALAAELRDAAGRLDALDSRDPAASIRAVFSWSYHQLSDAAARMFRLIGLHPGPDITAPAAASLAATGGPAARRLLRDLVDAQLIAEHVPGRYAFHDLLRAYAAEQASERDSEHDRVAAVGRFLDHYVHTAYAASLVLQPSDTLPALGSPRSGAAPEPLADYRQAMAWFEAEHRVLVAATGVASGTPSPHAWQLPHAMLHFLTRWGYLREWASLERTALDCATRLGDARGQAVSHHMLGNAYGLLGRAYGLDREYDQAAGHYRDGLRLYRQLGDRLGEAQIHGSFCLLAGSYGHVALAIRHGWRAGRLYRSVGDRTGQAELLALAAWHHIFHRRYRRAIRLCEQALPVSTDLGNRGLEAVLRGTIGYAERCQGNFGAALACYEQALSIIRDLGWVGAEATVLQGLGDLHGAAGDLPLADRAWRDALAILENLGDPGAARIRARLAAPPADAGRR
jgi:transcriptional regulator with XRE-family HTH domain/tetratricopeptide (TPR) repeat protein